jgi:hypothetical protein
LQYLLRRGVLDPNPTEQPNDPLDPAEVPTTQPAKQLFLGDRYVRSVVRKIIDPDHDVVGIYSLSPWVSEHAPDEKKQAAGIALRVGFDALPAPGMDSSIDDILNFKQDLRNQQWGFRRFLKGLATKEQTEAEIKDELEYLTRQYTKAMELHRLKMSKSFIETYIVPTAEVLATFPLFNWSKLAKLGVWATQRKIDLLETQLKAPGRECAYVFETRQQFGK